MHVMNEPRNDAAANVPTPEQLVARQVRLLRQGRGWSQQEVAEKMRAYGYQWSQATVTRLESASRPIRLNELADLAALFGVPVTQFLESRDLDFEWDDLETLENEIASLTQERDVLKAELGRDALSGDGGRRARGRSRRGAGPCQRAAGSPDAMAPASGRSPQGSTEGDNER